MQADAHRGTDFLGKGRVKMAGALGWKAPATPVLSIPMNSRAPKVEPAGVSAVALGTEGTSSVPRTLVAQAIQNGSPKPHQRHTQSLSEHRLHTGFEGP